MSSEWVKYHANNIALVCNYMQHDEVTSPAELCYEKTKKQLTCFFFFKEKKISPQMEASFQYYAVDILL